MIVTRRATPARITLGVTTVLTITTLKANADSNLPHTSYPKVKDLKLQLIIFALTDLYLGHRTLPLGLFCLHLCCLDRVLCRCISGEEEDNSAGQQQEPHSQGSHRH